MYDPSSIGAKIRMKLPQLTELERNVAESMIEAPSFNKETSLKDMAISNNVSEAMIVKVSKKLGFSGFRDFRENLVRYKELEVANLHSEIEPNDDSAQLIDKVFSTSIQAIEETNTVLNIEAFNRAASIIFQAKNIDLYGVGGSSSMARDLAHKLLKIGIKATVYDDAHMMMMSASILGDADAVVAISHSGKTRAVIDPVKLAVSNGAKVIALTNYEDSPLNTVSNVVLQSTSQGSHLLGENAASRIAQLNILDALFVAIAKKDIGTAEKNFNKTQKAVQHLRGY